MQQKLNNVTRDLNSIPNSLEEENTFLKDIEETAKRDFNALKSEYDQNIEKLQRKSTSNRQLQEQMNDLKLDIIMQK